MTMLAGTLIESARELAAQLREGQLQIPPPPESVATWPVIGQPLAAFWELASVNLEEALERIGPQIKAVGVWLLAVAGGVGFGLLQFVFAIVISGVLLAYAKGGERAADAIAVRLIGEQGPKFADLAGATVRSVSRGILGVALIQAILAGLGFLAVGLPAAGLLALLCLFLAVIQIGIAVVTIPAIIYIFATADTLPAVLFLVWAVFVTALDNVLKPILLGRGVQVPMAIIFVGAIGGFLAHGIIGLFVGSVVLALGYTLFRAWLRESRESEPAADAPATANSPAARPGEP
jgi:predicted PurR-regulated permease PerM